MNKGETKEAFLDRCYEIFKEDIFNRSKSLVYKNRIVCVTAEFTKGKANGFLHISSLNRNESFNILPCNNTPYNSICTLNCVDRNWTYTDHTGIRDICIYRAGFIGIIKTVIDLANVNDKRIRQWEEYNAKNGKYRAFIRYIDELLDYVIVLSKSKKRYYILSAYPVFFYKSKKEFDRAYLKNK